MSEPQCEGLVPFCCGNPSCPVHGVEVIISSEELDRMKRYWSQFKGPMSDTIQRLIDELVKIHKLIDNAPWSYGGDALAEYFSDGMKRNMDEERFHE